MGESLLHTVLCSNIDEHNEPLLAWSFKLVSEEAPSRDTPPPTKKTEAYDASKKLGAPLFNLCGRIPRY